MKKIILNLICALLMASFIPTKVFAAGGFSVSTMGVTLHPGESTSFSVTASNAAGRINISSSDPSIASVSTSAVFLDLNSESVTITAGSIGSATISIVASSNFATYDEENLGGQSQTISVNVVEVPQPAPTPAPAPTPTPTPAPTPSNNGNNTSNEPSTTGVTDEPAKSNNVNVAIAIDGYEIVKEKSIYKATIPHDVSKITIKATPEDEKAAVVGGGEITLKVGKNTTEITVTAEDGTVKVYKLEITREAACEKCATCEKTECSSQPPIFMIIAIVEGVGIIGLATFLVVYFCGKNRVRQ